MKLTIRHAVVAISLGVVSSASMADDLYQIYQLAQEKDAVILQSQATRDAAFEQINQARASNLPHVSLSSDLSYTEANNVYADTTKASASVGFSQSLYSQTNWLNLDISEKAAALQEAMLGYEQQNLMIRTAQAYFNVLRANDNVSFVQANKAAVARQLEQTKQRFNVGLTAITDVHEAQAEYDRTLASEILAENTLDNSYEALRELTGAEHRRLNPLDTQRFTPVPLEQPAKFWLEQATDRNLLLNARRISKEIADQQIELARSGKGPTLSLTGGVGTTMTDYRSTSAYDSSIDEDFINYANVGLGFSMPLYVGGAVNSQVKQAQYGYVSASQALEQTYRSIQRQLNSSVNNVKASIGAIQAYKQTVLSSESALKATEAGFDVGTRTIVDVQTATRSLYQAKQELASARYDYILNILSLKQTAGILTKSDIQGINQGLKAPKV
jgi:outer membrane protein